MSALDIASEIDESMQYAVSGSDVGEQDRGTATDHVMMSSDSLNAF